MQYISMMWTQMNWRSSYILPTTYKILIFATNLSHTHIELTTRKTLDQAPLIRTQMNRSSYILPTTHKFLILLLNYHTYTHIYIYIYIHVELTSRKTLDQAPLTNLVTESSHVLFKCTCVCVACTS